MVNPAPINSTIQSGRGTTRMASASRVRRPSIRSSCSISIWRNEAFWMKVWSLRPRTSSLNRLPHSLTDRARALVPHRGPALMDDRAAVADQRALQQRVLLRLVCLRRPGELKDGLGLELRSSLALVVAVVGLEHDEGEQDRKGGAEEIERLVVLSDLAAKRSLNGLRRAAHRNATERTATPSTIPACAARVIAGPYPQAPAPTSSGARRSSPRPGRRRRTSSRGRPGDRRSPSRSAACP